MFIVGSKAPNCTIGVVAIDTVKYTCFGVVAQLVRASPCHGEGRGSEPRQPRKLGFLAISYSYLCLLSLLRYNIP